MDPDRDFSLAGRTALITGAGQGVGAGIARLFARHGATVLVNDFFGERADEVVESIAADGGKAVATPFDVSDAASVDAALGGLPTGVGTVDILVNNAGNAGPSVGIGTTPFWETDPDEWDRWLSVNLFGVLTVTRAVVEGMIEKRHGRVITVVSDAGRIGEAHFEAYSAAKAGAAGFTRSLARSVGRYGITANSISLSAMRTPATTQVSENPDLEKRMLASYIVRRLGEPDDVAPVALLLASDAGEWISGQTYPVNGGFSVAV